VLKNITSSTTTALTALGRRKLRGARFKGVMVTQIMDIKMDNIVSSALAELATNLAALTVKGTVTSISTKVKAIQNEKDLEAVKNSYDEIINELLSEREEAVRIAQIYKSELDRYQISDDDIKHLHNTVGRVLQILQGLSPTTDMENFDQFKDLINIDTLKAMQLLGFNYKQAIGEPLTNICAEKINSLVKPLPKKTNNAKRK